ncbi:SUF system NifU family Fe-S cluster assembly protein [Calothrix sp. FACHB-156]|nr:SUF system NifU family Fe-S cluster assembly protein [Calothrix sp. FACHB-156]
MASQRATASPENQRHTFEQVIQERSKKPRYRGKTIPVHRYHKCSNPYCGDTIELTLKLNQASDTIEEIKFQGEGCAISIASADLMAGYVQGKSISEALNMIESFHSMMQGETEFPRELQKLNILKGVSKFPLRVKCATLGWKTLKAAIESSAPMT